MEGGQMEDLFLDSMEKQSSWFVNWIPFSHRLLSFLVCFVRNMSFSEAKMIVEDSAGSAPVFQPNKMKLHPDLGFFSVHRALWANSWIGYILLQAESWVFDCFKK